MRPGTHGLMAEFDTPDALLAAATRAHERGYRRMDAYSPFPIEGLDHAIGFKSSRLPVLVFIGGVIGGLGGYLLQWWTSVIDYPVNIGGRPFHSWPSFIPVTFECAVLGAALTAVLGMFALNGLPQPYHPVFNAERFQFASKDRFFLCIEARDPLYDREKTARDLTGWKAKGVVEVPE
jgi:hypothetical protein